ncbi:S1C family serine protease [Paenibacillus silvisoli]|uniref:S1C family serine protease n=1 Tax=Paenibacillus silvisoli TaxID=3110539 RepID=UPI0028046AB7|nr:trypsin-like peptidase domain-containing protein [Paenibacillus silvisoli]
MSLFDDDFYSTRVSRRIRSVGRRDVSFGKRGGGIRWTPVRMAVASSVVSALAVVLVFGAFTGFERGDHAVTAVSGVTNVGMSDNPLEKTISAAAKMRPAVVSIINEQAQPDSGSADGSGSADDGSGEGDSGLAQAALGSGFIFEKVKGKAHIITNNHVIEGAVAVKAVLSTGETLDAKVVGTDAITDLAVLEVDADHVDAVAEFGDSDGLRAGQWVMAIGNPLGLSDSLSMGIVSKTKRVIPISLSQDGNYDWEQEVIQIDASINQGNSGGPLIDLDGNVIGINSMKIAEYGVEGVGFAIPSHIAMPIVQSLLEYGKVKRPYLGVYTMDLDLYLSQQTAGAGLGGEQLPLPGEGSSSDDGSAGSAAEGDDVAPEGNDDSVMQPQGELKLPEGVDQGVIVLQAVGPAAEAGLAFNDIIVKLDNMPISSTMELRKYLYGKKEIGDEIEVTFYRDGEKRTTTFKLAEKTEE